jgi:heme A synthase
MLGKVTVFLFFLLLIWGNLVAGLGVGLACPDWPLCHGKIIPPPRFDIYMEWMHRNIGLVATIFLFILSYKRFRNYPGSARSIPVITIFLLLSQIVLGGIVVLLELPVDFTTVHFANALLIFALVFYMAFFDGKEKMPSFSIEGFNLPFVILGLMVFCQAVLGAYVRHSGAGLACPDFPKCLGFWVPPELSGTVLAHFSHRILAYLIFITVAIFYALSYFSPGLRANRSKISILLGLIFLQLILGISVIHSKLFFLTAALHLSIALLILSTVLYAWFQEMKENRV